MSTGSSREEYDSLRVELLYATSVDFEAFRLLGIIVRSVRLVARVSFQQADGWSEIREAIIDTGSPISIIPKVIWQEIDCRPFTEMELNVHIAGETVTANLGRVVIRLHDDINISPPLWITAYLSDTDTHPLVLGFEDFLTEVELYSNYRQRDAYLVFQR